MKPEVPTSRWVAKRSFLRQATSGIRLAIGLFMAGAQVAGAFEDIPRSKVILRRNSEIQPGLSLFPDVFKPDSSATPLLCVTNDNPSSEALLEPQDEFRAAFEEGPDRMSLLSTVLLLDSLTLEF